MKHYKITDTLTNVQWYLFSEESTNQFLETISNPEDFVVEIIDF